MLIWQRRCSRIRSIVPLRSVRILIHTFRKIGQFLFKLFEFRSPHRHPKLTIGITHMIYILILEKLLKFMISWSELLFFSPKTVLSRSKLSFSQITKKSTCGISDRNPVLSQCTKLTMLAFVPPRFENKSDIVINHINLKLNV